MQGDIKFNGCEYKLAPKEKVHQGAIDAWVLHAKGQHPEFDNDQLIGFAMLDFNLFYDDAKPMVEKALKSIHNS